MLLALGLAALLWTATADTAPDDILTMSGTAPCVLEAHSQERGDADSQWRAEQHTIAAVTESVWKSALVHAELAATRLELPFDTTRAASSPDPPVGSAPYYLRHTPLLI